MTARLITMPVGLGRTRIMLPPGPLAVGAGANDSIGGTAQTYDTPAGYWTWRIEFTDVKGRAAQAFQGMVDALNGGTNALICPMFDPDMHFRDAGVTGTDGQYLGGSMWSNGLPWSNGAPWKNSYPSVEVAGYSALDTTIVALQSQFWGHTLRVGHRIGFFPFHLGMYRITEVLEPGIYRVWPKLRKAVAFGNRATLYPVIAGRMKSRDGATHERGLQMQENQAIELMEVPDYDVRAYYSGGDLRRTKAEFDFTLDRASIFSRLDTSKMFGGRVGEIVTCTRASIGTIWNSSGAIEVVPANTLRLDWDPATHEPLGLLTELASTNMFTESEFRNGAADATFISAGITSTTFGGRLVYNKGMLFTPNGSTQALYKTVSFVPLTTYTISAFIMMTDGAAPSFPDSSPASASNDFMFVVAGSGYSPTNMQNCGGGCYRVWRTVTTIASPTNNFGGVSKADTNSSRGFTVSGFQCEPLWEPTSYIPTTTAATTRNADICQIPVSRMPFSTFEGTVLIDAQINIAQNAATSYLVLLRKAATSDQVSIPHFSTNVTRMIVSAGGVTQVSSGTFPVIPGAWGKFAIGWRANDFAMAKDGAAPATDDAGAVPVGLNEFSLRSGNNAVRIKRLTYLPRRMPDGWLQGQTA